MVHGIYAPVVRNTAISFEWEAPSVDEMARRIESVLAANYPWVVVEADGQVRGYAYAGAYRTRAAYRWAAEVSVYVDAQHHRGGLGRILYGSLIRLLEAQGFRSAYALATTPNPSSDGLHRSLGFREVGRFPHVGYKFGRWHDVVCWHLALPHPEAPPGPIRPLEEVMTVLSPDGRRIPSTEPRRGPGGLQGFE